MQNGLYTFLHPIRIFFELTDKLKPLLPKNQNTRFFLLVLKDIFADNNRVFRHAITPLLQDMKPRLYDMRSV